jgi:hypothetical protein
LGCTRRNEAKLSSLQHGDYCANGPRMTCRVSRVASCHSVCQYCVERHCRHNADRALHNCSTTCRNWCWQSNLLSCSWAWEHGVDSVSQHVHAPTHTARLTAPWEDSPTVSTVELAPVELAISRSQRSVVMIKRESHVCTSRKRAGVWAKGCACWNET